MASKGIGIGAILVFMTMVWAGAKGQTGCSSVITGLSPCLTFITGNSTAPSSSCCTQLANVVQSQPQCLCTLVNSGGGAAAISLGINQTLALQLPSVCKVQTPSISSCNATNGPATSPVTSPAVSPVDSSDEEPDSPNSPVTPSTDAIPSGNGSKTVPTTGVNTSHGNAIISRLPLSTFLLFIVSCASIITIF